MKEFYFLISNDMRSSLESLSKEMSKKVTGGLDNSSSTEKPPPCGGQCKNSCAHYCHADCEKFCGSVAYKA
jgi:hypothetical protein